MNEIKFNIVFPIVKAYSSINYGLIILDSAGITHFWDKNGDYDGYEHDPSIDVETKTPMN